MIWADGLAANPGALEAEAQAISQAHTTVTGALEAHRSTDVGPWRGEAARAERDKHRRIGDAMDRQANLLPRAASALNDAASTLRNIQSTQYTAIDRAASWQYRYSDRGVVRSTVDGINLDPRRPFIRGDLQRIGFNITLRLNACDWELSARLGALVIEEAVAEFGDDLKNTLIGAGEWAGDQIMNGLEWGRDRITDAAEWGQDRVEDVVGWFNDRVDAARPAWDRLRESLGTSPRWLTDLLEKGEVPQISEVAGTAVFLAGQGAGVAWNFLTGDDKHFFDDGRAWSGEPVPYEAANNFEGVYGVMESAMDIYGTRDKTDPDGRAAIQVTAIGEGDDLRYVVSIPGSTEGMGAGGWFGRNSGMDWAANMRGVGYGDTAATQGAMDAIDKAIAADLAERRANGETISGNPRLLLTGHSQGGIVAANMTANEEFMSRYNVQGIVSAGSPQQTIPVPESVQVYNFHNKWDPVPAIDFDGRNVTGGSNHQGNVNNIVIPHSGSYSPWHTHDQGYYLEGIRDFEGQPDNAQLQEMYRHLGHYFDGETTRAYRVEYGRETTP